MLLERTFVDDNQAKSTICESPNIHNRYKQASQSFYLGKSIKSIENFIKKEDNNLNVNNDNEDFANSQIMLFKKCIYSFINKIKIECADIIQSKLSIDYDSGSAITLLMSKYEFCFKENNSFDMNEFDRNINIIKENNEIEIVNIKVKSIFIHKIIIEKYINFLLDLRYDVNKIIQTMIFDYEQLLKVIDIIALKIESSSDQIKNPSCKPPINDILNANIKPISYNYQELIDDVIYYKLIENDFETNPVRIIPKSKHEPVNDGTCNKIIPTLPLDLDRKVQIIEENKRDKIKDEIEKTIEYENKVPLSLIDQLLSCENIIDFDLSKPNRSKAIPDTMNYLNDDHKKLFEMIHDWYMEIKEDRKLYKSKYNNDDNFRLADLENR